MHKFITNMIKKSRSRVMKNIFNKNVFMFKEDDEGSYYIPIIFKGALQNVGFLIILLLKVMLNQEIIVTLLHNRGWTKRSQLWYRSQRSQAITTCT